MAAAGDADDVVALLLAAGAHAAPALDAGGQIDADRGMAAVDRGAARAAKREPRHVQDPRPVRELGVVPQRIVDRIPARSPRPAVRSPSAAPAAPAAWRCARPCQPRRAAARGRQHALAADLDDAGAAIAVGPVAVLVAEMRQVDAVAGGGREDRLARARVDRAAVEREADGGCAAGGSPGSVRSLIARLRPRVRSSCANQRSTERTGLGAAWPSPQIDASAIAAHNSSSSARSHRGAAISSQRRLRALATGRALAAGLVAEERHHVARGVDRAVVLRQHDQRRRADQRAVVGQRVEVERLVGQRRRAGCRRRRPPGRNAYSAWPSAMPPANSSINSRAVMPTGAT